MPSSLPLVLGVLILTGFVSAGWRLSRIVISRRSEPPSTADGAVTQRVDAARELSWTLLLVAQFVFIEIVSESREVPQTLAIAGSIVGGLCLIAALVALGSCIAIERSLIRHR